jgi:hypothetical protein
MRRLKWGHREKVEGSPSGAKIRIDKIKIKTYNEEVKMNKYVAAIIVGFFFAVTMSWALTGVHGTVYKGEGTEETAGYANVRASADTTYYTTANASGGYGIQNMEGGHTYYLYAWKEYGYFKYTDDGYEYIGEGQYVWHDFHLHPGEPPKK